MCRLFLTPRPAAAAALLLLAALAAGAAFSQGERPGGRKVALLVGVNQYQKRGFPDLSFAEADVRDLADVLKAGGFEVELLAGENATLAKAERGVDRLLSGRGKED